MNFTWDLSFGTVLVMGTTLLSIAMAYGHAFWKFRMFERKINILFAWWARENLRDCDPALLKDVEKFFR